MAESVSGIELFLAFDPISLLGPLGGKNPDPYAAVAILPGAMLKASSDGTVAKFDARLILQYQSCLY